MREELEQLLSRAVHSYFQRGNRVARNWAPGPVPRLDAIRGGTLGRDLEWLERVASGQVETADTSEVTAVRRRILEDLYTSLAGDEPALPPDFPETPLGQLLAAAEEQAAAAESARALVEPTPAATPAQVAPGPAGGLALESERQVAGEPLAPSPSVSPVQWLLGEGTIKGVLYLGGLLVVAAATIFVVNNWGNFPGYLKFGSIFMATLGLYLLGYTLYNTPLRTAGVTFIGIGSLIAPLNFYALYQFVLRPTGAPPEGAWLLGSVFCLGLYGATAWWLRTSLLSYAAALALAVAMWSVLRAASASGYLYAPTGLVVAGMVLFLAHEGAGKGLPDFLTTPFRRLALLAGALLTLALLGTAFETRPQLGPAWNSVVIGFVLAAALFGYHGHVTRWFWTRGAAYCLLPFSYVLFLAALHAPTLVAGAAIMALGILYLGVSFTSPLRSYGTRDAWTLRGIGYTLALLTTGLALGRTQDLALALVADVAILAGSAYAYRDRDWWIAWAWSAIWLFMLPWLLVFTLIFPASLSVFFSPLWSPAWSLGLALLCGNYLVLGAALRRWNLGLAAGFVSAALTVLPLSALMAAVFSKGLAVGTALFAASVLIYGAVALTSGRAWLLHLGLPLLNVALWSALNLFVVTPRITGPITIGSYVALSLAQLYAARWLEVGGRERWAAPVYVWAVVNLLLSFTDALIAALIAGAAIGFRITPHTGLSPQVLTFLTVSLLYAAALFHFAWLCRSGKGWLAWTGRSAMTYLGLAVLAGAVGWGLFDTRFGQYHLTLLAGWLLLGSLVGRALPAGDLAEVYGKPLRTFGQVAVWVPLILGLFVGGPLAVTAIYLVAAVLYGTETFYRKSRELGYVTGLLAAVAYAGLLQWQGINEAQAYVIPYGLAILFAAHLESVGREGYLFHPQELLLALTWGGLTLLFGFSLVQSLSPRGGPYLALLVGETVVGLLWGLRTRSRSWVALSSGFLAAEALLQVIDDVIALPAWVLLGGAGVVLLSTGVLALAKRQEILATGRAVAREWEAWSL